MQIRTPHKLSPSILKFCNSIVPFQRPFYVQVIPLANKPVNECFTIVPEHVSTYGGEQQIGWTIGEWPKVLIEAEFHTIWRTGDGMFVDISPKETDVMHNLFLEQILFLPDQGRKYEGRQVDNIRKPLRGDKRIHRFCQLGHDLFLAMNEGDLAYKRDVPITPRIEKIKYDMMQVYIALTRKYG